MGLGKSLEKRFEKAKSQKRIDTIAVFEAVTNYPCQSISKIAEKLGSTQGTVSWHLKKLEESGLVAGKRVSKRILYYPVNLVDPKDVEELALLLQPEVQNIIQVLAQTSGLSKRGLVDALQVMKQSQVYSYTRYLERLVKAGFVKVLKDRKMNYYYLTRKIFILYQGYTERETNMARALINKLNAVLPELSPGAGASIVEKTLTSITTQVRITKGTGGMEQEHKIYLNPLHIYASIIQLQQF